MQANSPNYLEAPVFILAPIGNDARNAMSVFTHAHIAAEVFSSMEEMCDRANDGTGMFLISEDVLDEPSLDYFLKFIDRQPAWSDIPVVLITAAGDLKHKTHTILNFLGARANITLVEKPLRVLTLISVIQSNLRSRQRQFQVQQLLKSYAQAVEHEQQANALLADKAAHLETLVAQRTTRLSETIGDLEAFSYSIAHDMRAPLRSLHSFSEILLQEYAGGLEEEARHLLHRIANAAGRMDKLIQDVLDYSRVMRADFPLEIVDVEPLLRGIVDTYPAFAPDKVDITILAPLPPVIGNEAMLTQIFSNLMGNAVKFVVEGRKPEVKIWAERRGGMVRMFVEDKGIGIAPDQHDKIFGIFQQASRKYEGTGIGLAICKKAAERIGGAIGLQSALGQGTTFWVDAQQADEQKNENEKITVNEFASCALR